MNEPKPKPTPDVLTDEEAAIIHGERFVQLAREAGIRILARPVHAYYIERFSELQ